MPKLALFSDTHGDLRKWWGSVDLAGVDAVVFLGDVYYSDFELFKDVALPKYGVLGNHMPWEGGGEKSDVFARYGIEDIAWKKARIAGVTAFGIPGNGGLQAAEAIELGIQKAVGDVTESQRKWKELKAMLAAAGRVDAVFTHLPVRGAFDENTLMRRGLKFLRDYVEESRPVLVAQGHMHVDKAGNVGPTAVQAVYPWAVVDLPAAGGR